MPQAGFTTVRDVGADGYADFGLRDAINDGDVPGPRILASGPPLTISGGHCDDTLHAPEYKITALGVADGVDEALKVTRRNIKYGADVIKICATGGVLSFGDDPRTSQYSYEELKAIIADIHRLGRKAAAHAHGGDGIKLPKPLLDKARIIGPLGRQNIAKVIKAGVPIALGTDAGVYPHGMNAHEFATLVELGMTPAQAIRAGTVNAAELLGWSDKVGSIEAGKYADLIAIGGDPLKDIKLLQRVPWVMKGGAVVKQN